MEEMEEKRRNQVCVLGLMMDVMLAAHSSYKLVG